MVKRADLCAYFTTATARGTEQEDDDKRLHPKNNASPWTRETTGSLVAAYADFTGLRP